MGRAAIIIGDCDSQFVLLSKLLRACQSGDEDSTRPLFIWILTMRKSKNTQPTPFEKTNLPSKSLL